MDLTNSQCNQPGNTEGGKYQCAVDLLFDWFGLVCFANKNKNFQLSFSWFQTSQTGGQRYSDTSPFSIPWTNSDINKHFLFVLSFHSIIWFFSARLFLSHHSIDVDAFYVLYFLFLVSSLSSNDNLNLTYVLLLVVNDIGLASLMLRVRPSAWHFICAKHSIQTFQN